MFLKTKDDTSSSSPGNLDSAFFLSGYRLPESGLRLVTATSGNDWADLIFTFRLPTFRNVGCRERRHRISQTQRSASRFIAEQRTAKLSLRK